MHSFADWIIENLKFMQAIPPAYVYLIIIVVVTGLLLMLFVAPVAGILVYVERRVAGKMQSRIGPNRVGPQGILQFVADGIKLLLKEDIIPAAADRKLFKLAPYIVFVGSFMAFAALPFSQKLIAADLNVGILYIFAVSSMVVVGIIMSGWASNNKWALLGGMRSAAQIISYEVPQCLSVLAIILLTGTLSMQGMIKAQGWAPQHWFLFHNPFAFIAFFIYFISAVAECNRVPFDIPEAESELVSGYNTEYSGFRFGLFFLAEFANVYLISAVAVTLFLGGWQTPFNIPTAIWGLLPSAVNIAGLITFLVKAFVLVFVIMWLRWTLPRLRVDQLMTVSWKYLTPIAFFNLVGTAAWMLAWHERGIARLITG